MLSSGTYASKTHTQYFKVSFILKVHDVLLIIFLPATMTVFFFSLTLKENCYIYLDVYIIGFDLSKSILDYLEAFSRLSRRMFYLELKIQAFIH